MAPETVISLQGIEKSYGEGSAQTRVLRGVSFEVEAGEFLAIVGQSGSGKSTLLNIIGGLDQADEGDVMVLGHKPWRAPERSWLSRIVPMGAAHKREKISEQRMAELRNQEIGFVFQAFNLLDHLTCLGNVTIPSVFGGDLATATERGLDALERVGLADYAQRKPSELSGGQKQRVAIARALFARPQLLLCDEPTGNLDSQTGREVIEFFRKLNEDDGVTLLIVTHERRVSDVAKRIIQIRDGSLVEGDDAVAAGAGPT